MTQPEVAVGQIWHEVDPRVERYLQVLEVHVTFAEVVTLDTEECKVGTVIRAPRSRMTAPNLDRFNGKRGGYEFVRQS